MIESILKSFEVWSDAQGIKSRGRVKSIDNISLEGIARLRELILELAVRGKLVSQNPDDEPAKILLEKIEAEKKSEAGDKKFEVIHFDIAHALFNLPDGWSWAVLGNISLVERGGSPRPIDSYLTNDPDGLNWIKIGDTIKGNKYITSTSEKIRKEGLVKTRMVYPGDFLLTNSMSFGRPYITNIEGCIHDGWLRIHPPKAIDKDYLYHLLSSTYVNKFFKNAAAGAVVQNLNAEKVRELPLPIPPLSEQKRIVDKVEELMAVCDKLEKEETNNLKTHQYLVGCLLETFSNASNTDEVQVAWERISKEFDTLFCTDDSIDQLKETILQLAITGKLVKQNPKDEPASELFKKIIDKKNKLIDDKIVKGEKLDLSNEIIEGRGLPSNWIQVFLQDITSVITCGLASTPVYQTEGRMFLSAKNVKPFRFMPDDFQFVDEETYQKIISWGAKPEKGDILVTRVGAGIGESAIVDRDIEFAYYVSLTLVKPIQPFVNSNFLLFWLNSPEGVKKSLDSTFGKAVSAGNLNVKQVRKYIIPLPPLAEQNRIVERVYELFSLCETLKTKIATAEIIKVKLSKTVMQLSE
jgi:type I restriction enzyme S subunit